MSGGKHLLLLAGFVLLARCQNPTVDISPKLNKIFTGDLFYLNCNTGGDKVTWYMNDTSQSLTSKTWKFAVASPSHSGHYRCESNGAKSETITINVLEYSPSASLTMVTGNPVIQTGGSVILRLDSEDGLYNWRCWSYVKEENKKIKFMLRLTNNASVDFQTAQLTAPESIFWCTDKPQKIRSNQIIVRASDRAVSLEMYPLPAVIGEPLILRCLVWGTDQLSKAVFYKDNNVISTSVRPFHKIQDVDEFVRGSYKCIATYKHEAYTGKTDYHHDSESQDLFVQLPPIMAVLSGNRDLLCSCPRCPGITSYHWYHKKDGQQWAPMNIESDTMTPKDIGSYACRAVWENRRSSLSKSYVYSQNTPNSFVIVLVVVLVLLVLLGVVCVFVYRKYRKRKDTGAIYEDVALKSREKGDENYEVLQGAQMGAEYDVLHSEAQRKEGMGGAAGGEGGYEALKKEGMKGGEYDTLGKEGAGGGEGGYEALRKEGMKGEVYHTLGKEAAGGGEGGYEALKKEGMKEGVYHTLGTGAQVGKREDTRH